MAGHVFVVQGNLTNLSCDAVAYPTRGVDSPTWFPNGAPPGAYSPWKKSEFTFGDERRCTLLLGVAPTATQIVLLNMSHQPSENRVAWYIKGLTLSLGVMVNTFGLGSSGSAGESGGRHISGDVLSEIFKSLYEFTSKYPADVVLVTQGADMYSAAQATRQNQLKSGNRPPPPLTDSQLREINRLKTLAVEGNLALFVGAGCSVSAGLPSWSELLSLLAQKAKLSEAEMQSFLSLEFVDQAKILEKRLLSEGTTLTTEVASMLSTKRISLTHALLVKISTPMCVTTNYDTLYEDACKGAEMSCNVLPYDTSPSERCVLKMHGCVSRPDDIVLTRESYDSYNDRRQALTGIVQAMLITKHMLFVGFSMTDGNFHKIAATVRKAISLQHTNDGLASFGTVLTLRMKPLQQDLWSDVNWIPMAEDTTSLAECARIHEIFLDELSLQASSCTGHLLKPDFEGSFSPQELRFRGKVLAFYQSLESDPEAKKAPAYSLAKELFRQLGKV